MRRHSRCQNFGIASTVITLRVADGVIRRAGRETFCLERVNATDVRS